jgi:endonuclease YncB( thermonuclease family)
LRRGRLLVLLFALLPVAAWAITGKVVRVSDGDTITVLEGGRQYKIRLEGIDAPELGQAYGRVSKDFASTFSG